MQMTSHHKPTNKQLNYIKYLERKGLAQFEGKTKSEAYQYIEKYGKKHKRKYSPVTAKQSMLIRHMEEVGLHASFDGLTKKEASFYIDKHMNEYLRLKNEEDLFEEGLGDHNDDYLY